MGNSPQKPAEITSNSSETPVEKPKCPMCVCKVERAARDLCMVEKGQEECEEQIAALNVCLKKYGFDFSQKKE